MKVEKRRRGVNYGSNKVRFIAPVPAGARVRLRQTLQGRGAVEDNGVRITMRDDHRGRGQRAPRHGRGDARHRLRVAPRGRRPEKEDAHGIGGEPHAARLAAPGPAVSDGDRALPLARAQPGRDPGGRGSAQGRPTAGRRARRGHRDPRPLAPSRPAPARQRRRADGAGGWDIRSHPDRRVPAHRYPGERPRDGSALRGPRSQATGGTPNTPCEPASRRSAARHRGALRGPGLTGRRELRRGDGELHPAHRGRGRGRL